MNTQPHDTRSPDHTNEVTVRDFLFFLWRSRWFAVIGAISFGFAALLTSWIVTPEYTAYTVLLPVSSQHRGLGLQSISSAESQFSGLASLAGLSLGGESSQKTAALATLESQILTDKYIRKNNLLPVLYSKLWNPKSQTWRVRRSRDIPTLWKANLLWSKTIRTVESNPKTGLVTVTIRWKNPQLAATWANGIVEMTNDYLRQRAIHQAQRSITYLNSEVDKTSVVAVKNAIYTLMEAEIKKEMIAKGRKDFALRVIDPAVAPERKSFPRPVLWTIIGVLSGLFLGLLASILSETVRDMRNSCKD